MCPFSGHVVHGSARASIDSQLRARAHDAMPTRRKLNESKLALRGAIIIACIFESPLQRAPGRRWKVERSVCHAFQKQSGRTALWQRRHTQMGRREVSKPYRPQLHYKADRPIMGDITNMIHAIVRECVCVCVPPGPIVVVILTIKLITNNRT